MIDVGFFFTLTRTTFPIIPVIKSVSYAALDCFVLVFSTIDLKENMDAYIKLHELQR